MQNYYNKTLVNTQYYDPEHHYYKFIRPRCNTNNNDAQFINAPIVFYQIAGFKKRDTNKYDIRINYINANNIIFNYRNGTITKEEYDNFRKKVSSNKIKVYPVDNLEFIDFPRSSDITMARSCLLY